MTTPGPLGFIPILPKPAPIPSTAPSVGDLTQWDAESPSDVLERQRADAALLSAQTDLRYLGPGGTARALADAERYEALKALLALAEHAVGYGYADSDIPPAEAIIARARRAFGVPS